MGGVHCPECLLTPQAEELLERLEDKLRRTRPGDASWKTTICPRCGRLSGIFDEREGWSVGEGKDRGWASGSKPVAETKPVLQTERIAEAPSSRTPSTAPRLSAPSAATASSPSSHRPDGFAGAFPPAVRAAPRPAASAGTPGNALPPCPLLTVRTP